MSITTPTKTMPSPFKRRLSYPSPTSLKKIKSREPTPAAVTGDSYKLFLKNKEDKKRQIEELKEQRKIIRETKKNIKNEKDSNKKQSAKKSVDSASDSDSNNEPSPIKAEDLEDLRVNSWVVVPYVVEGEKKFFPGQIKALKTICMRKVCMQKREQVCLAGR